MGTTMKTEKQIKSRLNLINDMITFQEGIINLHPYDTQAVAIRNNLIKEKITLTWVLGEEQYCYIICPKCSTTILPDEQQTIDECPMCKTNI